MVLVADWIVVHAVSLVSFCSAGHLQIAKSHPHRSSVAVAEELTCVMRQIVLQLDVFAETGLLAVVAVVAVAAVIVAVVVVAAVAAVREQRAIVVSFVAVVVVFVLAVNAMHSGVPVDIAQRMVGWAWQDGTRAYRVYVRCPSIASPAVARAMLWPAWSMMVVGHWRLMMTVRLVQHAMRLTMTQGRRWWPYASQIELSWLRVLALPPRDRLSLFSGRVKLDLDRHVDVCWQV